MQAFGYTASTEEIVAALAAMTAVFQFLKAKKEKEDSNRTEATGDINITVVQSLLKIQDELTRDKELLQKQLSDCLMRFSPEGSD